MPVTFDCPSCRQRISAAVVAGSQVRCPLCDAVVTVPAGDEPSPAFPRGPMPYPPSPEVNQGMAIAALVTGLVGVLGCQPVGVVGLVLGIVALRRIHQAPRQYAGRGMAIAGICTGGVSILMLACFGVFFASNGGAIWREVQGEFHKDQCQENLSSIMGALQLNAQDTGEFAADLQFLVNDGLITADQLTCPTATAGTTSYHYIPGYSLTSNLDQIIIYEDPLNHQGGGGHVVRLDGAVRFLASPEHEEVIAGITAPDGTPLRPE